MTSKKKAKGKARRAAKQAKIDEYFVEAAAACGDQQDGSPVEAKLAMKIMLLVYTCFLIHLIQALALSSMAERKEATKTEEDEEKDDEVKRKLEDLAQRRGGLICRHGRFSHRITFCRCGNCNGLDHELSPRQGKICVEFANAFRNAYNTAGETFGGRDLAKLFNTARDATCENYASVWHASGKMLEGVASFFVTRATQLYIDEEMAPDINIRYAHGHAAFACYFEQTRAVLMNESFAVNWAKVAELLTGDDHTVVKYLRKRIPCSCLDARYKEVKSVKKLGICFNFDCPIPGRKVERGKMLNCTVCGEANYCSRECQKAHWSTHKKECQRLAEEKARFDSK